jgi:hypothetical protein
MIRKLSKQMTAFLPENSNPKKSERSTAVTEYRTVDLPLSAFLLIRGHGMLGVESENGQGPVLRTQELKQDILIWASNRPVHIIPRAFFNQVRISKAS